MAGMGPAPKPAGQRRRRHKAPVEGELPAEGFAGPFPALSRSYNVDGERKRVAFSASTRAWYETWARSPMAAQFTAVEWGKLARLAVLVDVFHRRPLMKGLAGEIRLEEASLGGSPLDRRRLGLRIAPAEPVKDAQLVALDSYRRELGA
jgi:hypothetical protein